MKALVNKSSSKKQNLRESHFEKFDNAVLRGFLSKRSTNILIATCTWVIAIFMHGLDPMAKTVNFFTFFLTKGI